jgi:hypothetical protein
MYCDQEILMDINGGGKWAAFNVNGGYHQCSKQKDTKKQEPIVMVNNQEDKPEAQAWIREVMEGPKIKELEERIRKIEAQLLLFQGEKKK